MSADNGVYILESPIKNGQGTEFRVIHAQAIENINYDVPEGEFNDEQLINYFGDCKILTAKAASTTALELEKGIMSDDFCPILEYGISTITMNRPFPI